MIDNPSGPREYVQVYTAYGNLAAEMVRLLLESLRIPARLLQESAGSVMGLTVGPLGEVSILVPAENEREAREILQAMEDGRLEEPYYYTEFTQSQRYAQNKQSKDDDFTKDQAL
jgi:hypothetical protein